MKIYRSFFCAIFFQFMASLAIFATNDETVEPPKDSTNAAGKSAEGEGDKEVSSQVISEESKDEKKNENINYVFSDEEIDGAGGYIFIGDGFLLGNGLQQSLSYGGTFFFSFAKKIRFGFSGGYIETLDNSNTNLFFIGSYSAYLFRFSKFWTSLGMNLGYGSINKTASFNVAPDLSFALHLAKDFGISLSASYLLFINEQIFLSKEGLVNSSIPLLSFRLEFGTI